jgi:hypothetical protein
MARTGENEAPTHRSLAPFAVTIVGFVLAFAVTLFVRGRSTHADWPAAAVALTHATPLVPPPTEAPLFPPPPEVAGVASATLLAPAEGSAAAAPAADVAPTLAKRALKHRKKKHASRPMP